MIFKDIDIYTYLPLGSVLLDHLGTQRVTVEAQ